MKTRRGRILGVGLHPALGHRGQMLTDLLEGRLASMERYDPSTPKMSGRVPDGFAITRALYAGTTPGSGGPRAARRHGTSRVERSKWFEHG